MTHLLHGPFRIAGCLRALRGAALALALGACGPDRSAPNVLLVTVDTLRQDALSCYGGATPTPTWDRLAAEGARFLEAYSAAPTTLPSHASLLTGTYPHRHGVRRNGFHRLGPEAETLAEILGRRGYRTAAFVGTAVLDAFYGLDQGFDTYDDAMEGSSGPQAQRRARAVVDAATRWLSAVEEPFFLWVHVFDPHGPYDPPAPFDRVDYAGDPRDPENESLKGVSLPFYQELEGITDAAYPRALYGGEVRYVDAELERLFQALGDRSDHTLTVLTADHGESFGEDGVWFDHGVTLHDVCVRVPLVVRGPGVRPGTVVGGPVSLVDVLPSILELTGTPPSRASEGRSFAAALERGDESLSPAPVFFETFLPTQRNHSPRFGVLANGWKLIALEDRARLVRPGVGAERRNRAGEDADAFDALLGLLEAYRGVEPPSSGEIQPSQEQLEKLRALGYVR